MATGPTYTIGCGLGVCSNYQQRIRQSDINHQFERFQMLHLMINITLVSVAISVLLGTGLPLVLGVAFNGLVAVFLSRAEVDEESTAYVLHRDAPLRSDY